MIALFVWVNYIDLPQIIITNIPIDELGRDKRQNNADHLKLYIFGT